MGGAQRRQETQSVESFIAFYRGDREFRADLGRSVPATSATLFLQSRLNAAAPKNRPATAHCAARALHSPRHPRAHRSTWRAHRAHMLALFHDSELMTTSMDCGFFPLSSSFALFFLPDPLRTTNASVFPTPKRRERPCFTAALQNSCVAKRTVASNFCRYPCLRK